MMRSLSPRPMRRAQRVILLAFCNVLAAAGIWKAQASSVTIAPPADMIPPSLPLIDPGLTVLWDVNGDNQDDFSFNFRQPEVADSVDWQASVFPLEGAHVVGAFDAFDIFQVSNLAANTLIDASLFNPLTGPSEQRILAERFENSDGGEFLAPTSRGFLGFSIAKGSDTFYGYLELQVARSTPGVYGIDFIYAAYENIAGAPIVTAAIPEPGSLTLTGIVLGAMAGLLRRRRIKP